MLQHSSGSKWYLKLCTGYNHNSWLIEYTLQFHMTHPFWTTLKWMNLQTSNANIRHLFPKHCHHIDQPVCSIKAAPPIVLKANLSVKTFSRGSGVAVGTNRLQRSLHIGRESAVLKWNFCFFSTLNPSCWRLLFDPSDKGSLQNKFSVKVGILAQPAWPPPLPESWDSQKGKKKVMFILHFRLF